MKRSAAKDGAGAGGSNILRGGKNTYSSKAKLDNWVEEEYKPEINVGNFLASATVWSATNRRLVHLKLTAANPV
jgi:hypothetical protein